MDTVGQRIKQARMEMGLSQSALAEQTHVSQPTVANWERGSHAPRHAALEKIASALGSTPAWLIAGANDPDLSGRPSASHHHVPILDWPHSALALDQGRVQAYVAATTRAERPIALMAPQDCPFPSGVTLIFDRAQTQPDYGALYLIEDSGQVTLERYDPQSPPSGAILARLVMSLQEH